MLTTDKLGVFGNNVRRLISTVPVTKPNKYAKGKTKISKKHIKIDQRKLELLLYHQDLRQLNPEIDPDEHLWKPEIILGHKGGRKQKVKVMWSDLTSTWEDMHALFLHSPQLVCEYAVQRGITNKPGWNIVKSYLRLGINNENRCVNKSAKKKNRPLFKFGVQVPRNAKEALELDSKNGNTKWKDAIDTEFKQINEFKTFRLLGSGEKLPDDYKQIPYMFVFDVKFDLRHKARLVAGGHKTDPPREDIYSGVVGIETIRIGFLLGDANDLLVCAGDIGSAYLNGKTREKVYIIAGPEFGPDLAGKTLIIYKSIYGLRSSSARFHEHLSEYLRKLGYKPSKADSDFWIKDCGTHYEYIATYVDDVLVWSKDPLKIINKLKEVYTMKGVGVPEYYLGGNVEQLGPEWEKQNVKTALSAKTYIKNVIKKNAEMLGIKSFKSFKSPMAEEYHPEEDDSPLLDENGISKYQSLIGTGIWIITLGRFDISYAISSLAAYAALPREGHIKALQRVFGYLDSHPTGRVIIDPSYFDRSKFTITQDESWTEMYPDACEDLPTNVPEAKGKEARITVFVDADHARDKVTRRSVTGILILLNNTPIRWICKRQKTVESSTYGSELVAARIAVEMILEMRYVLRTLGVNLEKTSHMFGDNMSVLLNTTVPSSMLKKKHLGCSYHRVREAIAAQIMKFSFISSEENFADVLTKPLSNGKHHNLIKPWLFRRAEIIDLAIAKQKEVDHGNTNPK